MRLEFRDGKVVAWKSPAKSIMKRALGSVPPEQQGLNALMVGLNPALGYVWVQDRFVEGSIILGGFGFRG